MMNDEWLQAIGTPKPPQGLPKAPPRLPQGHPEAIWWLTGRHPEATLRLHLGYPEATMRLSSLVIAKRLGPKAARGACPRLP